MTLLGHNQTGFKSLIIVVVVVAAAAAVTVAVAVEVAEVDFNLYFSSNIDQTDSVLGFVFLNYRIKTRNTL